MTKEDLSLSLSPSRPARKRCCSRRHRDTRSLPHPTTPPDPPHPLCVAPFDPPAVGHPSGDARLVHTLTCKLPLRRGGRPTATG